MLCLKALALFSRGNVSRDHWSNVCLERRRDPNHLSDSSHPNTGSCLPNVSLSFSRWISVFKVFFPPLEDDNSILSVVYMNVAVDMADMPHNAT